MVGLGVRGSPLCWLRNKATFLLPPNFVSIFLNQLQWAEKAKILVGNNLGDLSGKLAPQGLLAMGTPGTLFIGRRWDHTNPPANLAAELWDCDGEKERNYPFSCQG